MAHSTGSGQTDSYPDFASALRPWYKDSEWQNLPLFPWMGDEFVHKLSEVYTRLEMETFTGKLHEKKLLGDYRELFADVQSEGNRILIKGDPGIGKTTFTRTIAYDWATGKLPEFDMVLVLKLKFSNKNQTIETMVVDQLPSISDTPNPTVSEVVVGNYLKSGRDRVLLILDGLDEIKLKEFTHVQKVLRGEAYRKCCILATTRPHVAETLYNKMTNIAKIKGFSREQAKQFIRNILDGEELAEFLRQLELRNMSQMHQVPLIIQALALIYKEYKKLPRTYTVTYDELVFFLRQSCKQSKDLTEEEIQAAMDEVNKLAFKGLIREDKQLVFSRDEIKDDNVRRLGILTAEKAGSGFNPTEVLQFAHATVQEHSASDHVVKRLLSDDRGPWEALVEQFHKETSTKGQELPDTQARKKSTTTLRTPDETRNEFDRKKTMVSSALKKIFNGIMTRKDMITDLIDFYRQLVEVGAFDDEIDFMRVSHVMTSHPITNEVLTEEEKTTFAHFLVKELLMETPKEWRAHEKSWLGTLMNHQNEWKGYFTDQKELWMWVANNPEMGKQTLLHQANYHKIRQSHPDLGNESRLYQQPYLYISQEFTQQLERVEYNKTLFRFIIGKLADHPAVRDVILKEMAVLLVQHSFDADTGGVLPINEILTFIMDLKSESILGDDENMAESEPFFITSALVHLTSTVIFPKVESLEADTLCALKVNGREADIPEFIPKVTSHMKHLQNIYLLELNDIDHQNQDLSSTYQEFTRVLYQSPHLISVELNNLEPKLTGSLLQSVPLSVRRLSVGSSGSRGTYTFPLQVHLVCLEFQNCLSRVGALFINTEFPNLKKLFIKNDCHSWEGKEPLTWSKEDAQSLLDAMRTGRMSALEELNVRGCCFKRCGPELIEILKSKSIRSAQLVMAELSKEDGEIFLKNIQDGHLDHMEFLSLFDNDEIGFLKADFETACQQREITLEMNPLLSGLPVESKSRPHEETITSEVLEPPCASGYIGTVNSADPEPARNDAAQTMTTPISNFFENRSGSRVDQLENPTNEAPRSGIDFSHIRNLASMFVNPANQPKPQETSEESKKNSLTCRVDLETPSHEAPQPQFDFSQIRNLASTFMNPANQPKPQETKEDSEQNNRGQELDDDLDLD